MVDTVYRLPI